MVSQIFQTPLLNIEMLLLTKKVRCSYKVQHNFVEINLHKKKWLINCFYNPHKNNVGSHLDVIAKTLDTYYGKYEKVVFLGDFTAEIEETTMKS